jgi:hypothetical protein
MTSTLGDHLSDGPLGDVEEPGEVDRCDRHVIVERVVGEWLPDVDARAIDECVDPAELIERLPNDEFGGLGLRDVARQHQHIRGCRRLDGERRPHDGPTGRAKGCSDAGTDPLRRAGDDNHLLLCS